MTVPLMTGLVRARRHEAETELTEQANRLAKRLNLPPLAPVDPHEQAVWAGAPLLENVAELLEWSLNELNARTLDAKPHSPMTKGQKAHAAA